MALGDTLLDGLQNQLNKAVNTAKNLVANDSKALYTTVEGTSWNSDAVHTDAQKRFLTKSPIPNYPKVGNLTYVYFSINPNVAAMIQKKHNKIKGWSNLLANYYASGSASTNKEFATALANYQPTNSQQSSSGIKNNSVFNNALQSVLGNTINAVNKVGTGIIDGAKGFINEAQKKTTKFVDDNIITPIKDYFDIKADFSASNIDFSDASNAAIVSEALDYVETPEELRKLSLELSKFVKSIDRPKIKLNTYTLNQYNRKRISYKNIEFPSIKVSFYDVKNSPVQRFFFSYLKCINDTFLLKSKNSYTADTLTTDSSQFFEDWGFNTDSDFMLIDRITVIEWLADKVTAYNFNNPKIENIDMSGSTLGDWNPQEVSITFAHEGITTDLFDIPELSAIENNKSMAGYQKYAIAKDIVKDVATLVQMNYKGSESYLTDNATAFIQGVLNNNNRSKWETIKEQAVETARKLGFAEEIDYYNTFVNDLKNYKEGGAKVIYNTLYSPAGAVGLLVNSDKNQMGTIPINS